MPQPTEDKTNQRNKLREANLPPAEALFAEVENPETVERIKEIMRFCEALPGVRRHPSPHRIVYMTKRAFAKIHPQRSQFWIDVIRPDTHDRHDPLANKHSVHEHIQVPNDLDLEKVKGQIEQSYRSTLPI